MRNDSTVTRGARRPIPRVYLILFGLLALAAICTTAYWHTLSNEYVYDDKEYILAIPAFHESIRIRPLFTQEYFSVYKERTYRPVGTLSFYIDSLLWKMHPHGAHAFNLVLHILVCWLVFVVLYELMRGVGAALFGASVFAAHPIHVEAVALASNREELLCALFYFGAFYLYLLWRRKRSDTTAFVILCTLSFTVAMFSKEMAATLPAVLALCEIALKRQGESALRALKRGIPFYAATGAVAAAFVVLRYTVFNNPSGGAALPGGSPFPAFLTMSKVFFLYLKTLFAPWPLCADYVIPAAHTLAGWGGAAVAGLIVFAAASLYLHRRCPIAGFAALFFAVTWLPVSNIIPFGEIMAERYVYIPSFAISALSAWGLTRLKISGGFRVAIACLTVAVLVALSSMRSEVWKNDAALWNDTVTCAPCSSKARHNLGNELARKGEFTQALEQYHAAPRCEEMPERFKLEYNRGLALLALGRVDDAETAFRTSVNLHPEYVLPYYNLGKIAANRRDVAHASFYFRKAIEIDPENALSYCIAGHHTRQFARTHDQKREAYQLLTRCVDMDPSNANARAELALVLLDVGHRRGALDELCAALSFDPGNPRVLEIFNRLGIPPEPAEQVDVTLFVDSPWKAWLFIALLFFGIIIAVMYVYYLAME